MINSLFRYRPNIRLIPAFSASLSVKSNPVVDDFSIIKKENKADIKNILNNVNKSVQDFRLSRLFAVVMIGGSQFKVTTEDVIIIRNQFYPTIGDRIRLEKVLLVGGSDFTVVGKPMLKKEFVKIEATVIEKTLSNNVIIFTYKPRKDNKKMDFHKSFLTLLRINSIDILGPVPGFNIGKINSSNQLEHNF